MGEMATGRYQMIRTIATVSSTGNQPELPGLNETYVWTNEDNLQSPCDCYQEILISLFTNDIIIYMHDDVTVHDPTWLTTILSLFETSDDIVAVGLGGATGLGNKDLYRKPYKIQNLARIDYASNQTDAEVHGSRTTGIRRVAVLDAFCMAVRTEWLRNRGGWPTERLTHHCLDLWLACECARTRKQIWTVGASCTHHGGGTSTKPEYTKAPWLQGNSLETDHSLPHRWIFDEYRDVLPLEI